MVINNRISLIFVISSALICRNFAFYQSNCITNEQDVLIVNCNGANLSGFPILLNPRIKTLSLSENHIAMLSLEEVGIYMDLEMLDLSYNVIYQIDKSSFYRLHKLKILKLNNNKLEQLDLETFAGLAMLKALDLSENNLNRLSTSIFVDLPRLEILNLSKNIISTISPGALTNLGKLKEFHLRHNELTDIPISALHSTEKLKILDLGSNRISTLPAKSFEKLSELESLDLSGNDLQDIDDEAFVNLQNLRHLNLQFNQLHRVPTMSFRHLSVLQTLTIGENQFSEIHTSAFEGLIQLKLLIINRCNGLKATSINAFSGLFDLQTLIMSENRQLSYLHPGSFEQDETSRTHLRQVVLADNALVTLPTTLLPYDKLIDLDLRRNPWRCDCEISFLGDILRRIYYSDESRASGAHCSSPEPYQNRPLISLTHEEFRCNTLNDMPLVVMVTGVVCSLFTITVLLILIVKYRRRLVLCVGGKNGGGGVGDRASKRSFYERQNFLPLPYDVHRSGFSSFKKPSSNFKNYGGKAPSFYGYETPVEHQAFLTSSDYYSSNASYASPETQTSTLTREGSFRVIQHYPIPITEL